MESENELSRCFIADVADDLDPGSARRPAISVAGASGIGRLVVLAEDAGLPSLQTSAQRAKLGGRASSITAQNLPSRPQVVPSTGSKAQRSFSGGSPARSSHRRNVGQRRSICIVDQCRRRAPIMRTLFRLTQRESGSDPWFASSPSSLTPQPWSQWSNNTQVCRLPGGRASAAQSPRSVSIRRRPWRKSLLNLF